MNIFDFRNQLIDDYASYIKSFIQIHDPQINSYVQQKLQEGVLWPDLLDILLRNKGRLGVSLSDGGMVERIMTRYEVSLGRVLPLKERLAKTDALIDQVVYRLYELTEEEIGVVEGKD